MEIGFRLSLKLDFPFYETQRNQESSRGSVDLEGRGPDRRWHQSIEDQLTKFVITPCSSASDEDEMDTRLRSSSSEKFREDENTPLRILE
uniref:Uncharacterized protein n=1 Tax=Vespula pensylvanica TaxID=30213 RepID=A0A834PC95_VESPE|nr:hypothetical protein H0235_003581 [Vespula pensylvanica]